jgi:hypothetical protein
MDQLAEGMELARPVVSPQGQLLAPAKTLLTARHLRLFRMWGVLDADIEGQRGDATQPAEPLTDAERQAIEQAVAQRFEGALGHPAMMEIARVALQVTMARENTPHA